MYQAVHKMLAANKSQWEAVQAIGTTIQAFEALLDEINACNLITGNNKKGETVQKKDLRMRIIERTMQVSSMLYALILQTNETYTGAKLDYTKTNLVKMRDMHLMVICETIIAQATAHLALLATADITAADIQSLSADIRTFAGLLPRQRLSVTGRKVTNENLKNLFAQADALLKNQLDRFMLRYKQTQPEFYSAYKNSRHVINYGVRHTKGKSEEKVG